MITDECRPPNNDLVNANKPQLNTNKFAQLLLIF